MGNKTQLALVRRSVKAYGAALLLYVLLVGVTGLLLCCGPLPEKWIYGYMLAAECAACLFLGLLTGAIMKKRGLFYGTAHAAVFVLLLLLLAFAASGRENPIALLRMSLLFPLLCGGIGGILGVNRKN